MHRAQGPFDPVMTGMDMLVEYLPLAFTCLRDPGMKNSTCITSHPQF